MAGNVIDGKEFSARVRNKVAEGVAKLEKDHGIKPVSYTHLTLPTILRV